jgi:glutamate N-acetyltransferase/amino-acid N-acetyltransferase
MARDGEGATKLVEVVVKGARTEQDAETIARSIADSPLVKTALYGNDPNWGRILAAAGKCGVAFDPERLRVAIAGIPVYVDGAAALFDAATAREALSESEVRLVVDLRSGGEQATFWTCDFSYDYIKINAEYHT